MFLILMYAYEGLKTDHNCGTLPFLLAHRKKYSFKFLIDSTGSIDCGSTMAKKIRKPILTIFFACDAINIHRVL